MTEFQIGVIIAIAFIGGMAAGYYIGGQDD